MLRNNDTVGVAVLAREWEVKLEAFRTRHAESGDVANGLQFPKHPLTQMEGHPFDTVAWLTAPIDIKDEAGKVIFADNVEFPETWGERDKQVVASKYFFGDHGQGFRETSLKQLLTRVSCTIALWAMDNGTFMSPADAENFLNYLIMIQLHQEFAFNSPVYFNVGVHCYGLEPSPANYIWDEESQGVIPCPDANKYSQISACFIQRVEDNMPSIMKLATSEAMLFKRGSGTGTDLSTLRSSRERLSGGGVPSGPVSFMGMYDRIAATVKSGGKCLAPYQPVFTAGGVKPVRDLAESGADFTVLSYDRPAGRIKAKRARAWKSGRKEVWALTTDKGEFHLSADHPIMLRTGEFIPLARLRPGMSLLSSKTREHNLGYVDVCLNNDKSGGDSRELLHRLVAADVCGWDVAGRVVHHGERGKLDSEPDNLTLMSGQSEHARHHNREIVERGEHVFQRERFPHSGTENGMHRSGEFWSDPERSEAYREGQGAILKASGRAADMQAAARRVRMLNLGYELINAGYDIATFEGYVAARKAVGRRCPSVPGQVKKFEREFGSYSEFYAELRRGNQEVVSVRRVGFMDVYDVEVDCPTPDDKAQWSGHNFSVAPIGSTDLFGEYLHISNTRRAAKMQTLKYWHPDIWEFVECKPQMERMARDLIAAGWPKDFNGAVYSTVLFQNANLSVRVDDNFMAAARDGSTFDTRAVTTGDIVATYPAEKLLDAIAFGSHDCGDPAVQFEDTMQRWHTVPNHGPINSTNPCGEYVHIDDSACNLASVNLLRFRIASGQGQPSWNQDHLFNTCRVACTSMETMVGRASYPTPEIALNSHRFRPLGGGYCNLGALLMVRGLPYDSPAGRLLGAALASFITGTFYLTSADLARLFGAFDGHAANADAMMNVIEMHRQNFIDQRKVFESARGITDADRDLFDLIQSVWRNAIFTGRSWGYRNSQATCIAPTGTIGFMMGCDTLGIEPETALVRYKHLAGGGVLKLVNLCVSESLRGLGYERRDIEEICLHMAKYGTIEDIVYRDDGMIVSSGLKGEHLLIFDCAFPPSPGEVDGRKFRPKDGRSIAPAGHVRMMGQATGCVSGAISKTVNMPGSSTVEDIKKIYFDAWRSGCKSISVYRDGSKGDQPVSTSAPTGSIAARVVTAESDAPGSVLPARFRMPDDRPATIHKFNIMGHEGFITVGFTPDGQPGEVFIEVAKQGSTVGGLMGVIGTLISLLLQHYVPMSKIVEKLAGQNFEPRGITKNINIRFCKSIVDYVGQYLGFHFVPGFQAGRNPVRGDGATPAASSGPDALEESLPTPLAGYAANLNGSICSACGEIMVRVGQNCEICSCGHTEGGCGA